ncbi:MAG TPA: 50S ribosomal protein L24 [Bacteroidota bacterium]|nr:50S ribosomal protein L24 [Bacteroidota bacterium]
MNVRKNDVVVVKSGNNASKEGKVLKVFPSTNRIIVEGVNIIKRHTRPSQRNPQGGVVQKEASIHASNVMVKCPKCNTPTRVGHKHVTDATSGRKKSTRICRNCGEMF